jgi:hypothetical protein
MNPVTALKKAMEGIQAASLHSNVTEIERLSRIAKRIKEIELHMKSLAAEMIDLDAAISAPPSNGSFPQLPITSVSSSPMLSPKGEIEITVDWAACGMARPKALVSERKASETLVAFITELGAALGSEALRSLTRLQVNRGPLLSEKPSVDFLNAKRGVEYAHHPIPGTPFHVITHSSTDEKIDSIRQAWRTLGLPPGGLSVNRAA